MRIRWLAAPVIAIWALGLAVGFKQAWEYELTPGVSAAAPAHTLFASLPQSQPGLPVLIVFAHPQCTCTRATIGNLDSLLAHTPCPLNTYVVIVHLPGEPAGWDKTDLWQSARAIPGVHVVLDQNGNLARQFGARTSGQTLLYAANGSLLFRGGITSERGHYGDNDGTDAILAELRHPTGKPAVTPVFGCSIFGASPP